jgi:alkylresorcinol/alkylpyrone synthase
VARPAALARLGDVGRRHALYGRLAPALAERVARAALAQADVPVRDVVALLVATSTGHLVPTLDYHLSARLGLSPAARHLALTDLGCVGALRAVATGGGSVARRIRGCAGRRVELSSCGCRTASQPRRSAGRDDVRRRRRRAGARCDSRRAGPQVVAWQSTLWADSLDARGAIQTSAGPRHAASPRLPRIVVANLRRTVSDFLGAQSLTLADLPSSA